MGPLIPSITSRHSRWKLGHTLRTHKCWPICSQRSLEGDALEWYYTLPIQDVQDFARVRDRFFEKYSHRVGYVPSLIDLIAEKMRSDEDFTLFADQWHLLAAKMRVPIPEVEQINLIVNNSNPYLRT